MPTISRYLLQNVSGASQPAVGIWVGIVNNSTATPFKSTAATDSNGLYTINTVPTGSYTVYTSPSNTGNPPGGTWTSTGDTNFIVAATDSSNVTTLVGPLTGVTTLTATGEVSAPDYKATGVASLTSATNGRWIGNWSTAGPPAGLTSALGDWGFDSSMNMWQCTVAGTPGTFKPIGLHTIDVQGSASAASFTCTVPSASVGLYRVLILEMTTRSDQAGPQNMTLQLGTPAIDTGANYDYQYFQDVNVTTTNAAPSVGSTLITFAGAQIPPTGAPAGAEAMYTIRFANADSTTLRKQVIWEHSSWTADAAGNAAYVKGQAQWRNTANAIAAIKGAPSAGNFVSWRAILYGWP